ncbi:hypothetical protein [Acuticoccus kandeliae]|uniref:hypothetical protein n=1 Tax=Acuticoccus kandeliae TaxID=2073160 RepID=UPI000D3E5D7C|nr:hypothetical protein [Acuticoccus kandeliae]
MRRLAFSFLNGCQPGETEPLDATGARRHAAPSQRDGETTSRSCAHPHPETPPQGRPRAGRTAMKRLTFTFDIGPHQGTTGPLDAVDRVVGYGRTTRARLHAAPAQREATAETTPPAHGTPIRRRWEGFAGRTAMQLTFNVDDGRQPGATAPLDAAVERLVDNDRATGAWRHAARTPREATAEKTPAPTAAPKRCRRAGLARVARP